MFICKEVNLQFHVQILSIKHKIIKIILKCLYLFSKSDILIINNIIKNQIRASFLGSYRCTKLNPKWYIIQIIHDQNNNFKDKNTIFKFNTVTLYILFKTGNHIFFITINNLFANSKNHIFWRWLVWGVIVKNLRYDFLV